ncbi:MAG: porin [Candidatus Brevundimonas phytovorans]|nr:porin [Brevundimonas sp.]WEK57932.1 MAG: porin [Brevundimonas sp.]
MGRISGLAVLMASVAAPAFAGSFYLQEQSVRGAGRAYSGEAADRGVSSLWWNPAAVARSGREVYVGMHGLKIDSSVDNAGSSITYPGGITVPIQGQNHNIDPIESGLVPNFAIATPVGDRFAVAFSLAAPYNFTTKYQPTSFARYDALTSELRTVNAGLTGAVQVTDWLDLGVGVDAQYVKAKLTSALPNLSPLLPDGSNSLIGDGWDYGWNVGAQVHKGPWDFGLSYRSKIEHELDGDVVISGLLAPLPAAANVSTPGTASFNTPWFASASVRYAVNDKLTLNAQVNRIGWSEFQAIDVEYAGQSAPIEQNYKDVTTGAIGADYALNDKVTLRAGVGYDPTPTRDSLRTARIPDADRWLFSVGGTAEVREGLKVDAGLTYIAFSDSTINDDRTFYAGTPAATTSQLRGTAEGSGVVASLGARWAF